MIASNVNNEPDIKPAMDRGEQPGLMEPLLVSESSPHRAGLADLAVDLAARSAGFRRSLPEGVLGPLADLVRAMNCYYSNLIEGHDTHPVDIERALRNDYSADAQKRNLQREAKAHIEVQRWIDAGGLAGKAATIEGVCAIHHRFAEMLPDELLWATEPDTGRQERVVPGALRASDVQVGRHVAVSPGSVARFLRRFEEVFGRLGRAETILAAAAAHHRLLWIHPFADGNGRVARLMSHAMLVDALDTGSIWSIARGLARKVAPYKAHLMDCDLPRRNDLDGRGTLSEEALVAFTRFFLETCIDQVDFMERLVEPGHLRTRILSWADDEIKIGRLPQKAGKVLEALLYRGELPRGEVPTLLELTERQSRRVVATLMERGVMVSASSRAPLRIAFPAALASRWMPGLFPEQSATGV